MIFKKKNRSYEMDMCSGNLFKKMFIFSLPLMLSGVLQLLYNACDLIVVGNFSGNSDALGAVGSTSALINLIINLFMGLSVGANVLCARFYASKNYEGVKKIVHTSVMASLICGVGLGIFGVMFARTLLDMMDNPIDLAVLYLQIYFIGFPCNMLYNFAAAILRAVGDTKRPLYILSFSGLVNVILNLIFVIVFHMDVAGVALATIISQAVSAILIMRILMKTKECYHFEFKSMKISPVELKEMVRIGLPAGIQGSLFSLSNVLIQSSVNGFGATAINGNTAATSVGGFVYNAMAAVYHATLSFTGQNSGKGNIANIRKVLLYGLAIVTIVGVGLGVPLFLLGNQILRIYTDVPAEIEVGVIRLHYLCLPYFLCGIMDVTCGSIRGMGYGILPMITSLVGVCGLRIVWILWIFRGLTNFTNYHDLHYLYVSYPITWIFTFLAHFICFIVIYNKRKKKTQNNLTVAID